jgi:hypothetical protein
MGFTRYWRQPRGIGADAWRRIVADSRTLLATVNIPLIVDDGNDIAPLVSDERICFNGRAGDGCEPFWLAPAPSKFECVKTMFRPYDVVVAAILAIAKHHAPSEILSVSSDETGSDLSWWDDCWQPAIDLCARAGLTFPVESLARLRADINHESSEGDDDGSSSEPADGGGVAWTEAAAPAKTTGSLSALPSSPRPSAANVKLRLLVVAGLLFVLVISALIMAGAHIKHVPRLSWLPVVSAVLIALSRATGGAAQPTRTTPGQARRWLLIGIATSLLIALSTGVLAWWLSSHRQSAHSPSALLIHG